MTQNTNVPNHQYDLVSALYHALETAQTSAKYIQDAQQANDQELTQFFQQVQQQANSNAQQAMQLLSSRAK